MFAFQFSSVTTFLVIIFIIRHGFASDHEGSNASFELAIGSEDSEFLYDSEMEEPEVEDPLTHVEPNESTQTNVSICRYTLTNEQYFEDNEDTGYRNFINAFNHLSFTEIDTKYKKHSDGEESDGEIIERNLMYGLVSSYFMELYDNSKTEYLLDTSLKMNPSDWCIFVIFGPDGVPDLSANLIDRYNRLISTAYPTCIDSLNKLSRPDAPVVAYYDFFFHWTKSQIESIGGFTEKYFKHFQDMVENFDPEEIKCTTVKTFCETLGHVMVQNISNGL